MVINYQNIDIYQEDHLILQHVNFEAEEGELIYLIGQVGSGKTSLLKSIYGEIKPEAGKAEVLGMKVRRLSPERLPKLRKQLGIVFQDFQLLPDRTVYDNLDFVLQATGWTSKAKRDERIKQVLEEVGLPQKAGSRPYELSGGEQQRICIARAILNKPALLLADEPTGNLDHENGRNIIQILKKIQEDGSTVIITTHNLQWLKEYPGTVYRCENHELIKEESKTATPSDADNKKEDVEEAEA